MHCIQGDRVDVDLLLLVVPPDIGIERSHIAFFKLEIGDHYVTFSFWRVEKRGQISLAVDIAGEVYGMEVDKVEDILHIDIVEIHDNRVVTVGRCLTINTDRLRVAGNIEIFDGEMLLAVSELVGVDGKYRISNEKMGFLDIKRSNHLVFLVSEECHVGIELSSQPLLLGMIVHGQAGTQGVADCCGLELVVCAQSPVVHLGE